MRLFIYCLLSVRLFLYFYLFVLFFFFLHRKKNFSTGLLEAVFGQRARSQIRHCATFAGENIQSLRHRGQA